MIDSAAVQGHAFALLVTGVLLWVLTPVLERLGGEPAASGSVIGGFALLVGSTVLGFASSAGPAPGLLSNPISVMSLVFLGWAALTYVLFRAVPDPRAEPFEPDQKHCVPVLVYGKKRDHKNERSNLRTRLTVHFDVVPTNSRLHARAWASGRAYYGLHFVRRTLSVSPDVQIECLAQKNAGCRAIANVLSQLEDSESPLLVSTDHAITSSGDEVTVKVTMLATVGASGGSLAASGGGFGGSIGLPAAAMSFKVPMGVFIWKCEPGP